MRFKYVLSATCLSLFLATSGQAQDNELTPGIVEQIDIAAKLTNYGMAREDPLLLLAAAKLLAGLAPEAAASAPAMGLDELVAKAKEFAGDEAIDAMAESITDESSRGLCHGPGTVYGCF